MSEAQHGRIQNVVTLGAPFSSSPTSTGTDAHPRRVSNACQGCKRRKAKCSGQPAPCERCRKLNSFCHFDEKLDTRRKTAWTASEIQQRQQYILHAVLHALRCNDDSDLKELLETTRQNESPHRLAQCLLRQIHSLQERQIIAKTDLDIHDVLSLAVEGLTQGQTGRKPHGLGAWNTPRSLAVPGRLSESDRGQQTNGHIQSAYLSPKLDTGALAPDHTLPKDSEALSQFSFDPSSMYYQPTAFRRQVPPFGDNLSPLALIDSDTARSLGLGNAAIISEERVPPVVYSTFVPSTSSTNRLASAQHLNTLPATSMLHDRLNGADTVLDTPIVDSSDWVISQQLLDGFCRP